MNSILLFARFLHSICYVPLVVVYILYVCIMYKKKAFHSNLRLLLCFLPLADVEASAVIFVMGVYSVWRPVTFVDNDDSPVNWWMFFHNMGLIWTSANAVPLLIDRIVATGFISYYGRICQGTPWIAIWSLTLQFSSLTAVGIYASYVGSAVGMSLFGLTLTLSIVTILGSSSLPFISRRNYRLHRERGSNINLRYQTAENIRVSHLLCRCMIVYVVGVASDAVVYYLILFQFQLDDDHQAAARTLLLCSASGRELFYIVATVASNPTLKKNCLLWSRIDCTKKPEPLAIRAADGRRLDTSAEGQRNAYFEQYGRVWNNALAQPAVTQ